MNPHLSSPSADYWKQKISAYLHDPPDKVLDILGHGNRAESLARVFGFEKSEEFRKNADFAASAADRLPWPDYKKTHGIRAGLEHGPLFWNLRMSRDIREAYRVR